MQSPWYNARLKSLKRIKQRHWQQYSKNRNIVRYAQYEECAKSYQSEILSAKGLHEKNLFGKKGSENKNIFKYFRKQTTLCSEVPCLKGDNVLAVDDKEKASLLSEYFASVFFSKDNHIMPDFDADFTTNLNSFTCETRTMVKIAKRPKLASSPGPDGITAMFLKNSIAQIANPLCKLFNVSLSNGYVPKEWKIAYVIPVYKKAISSYHQI